MSAIVGIIGKEAKPKEIKKMLDLLKHRGPDKTIIKDFDNGSFGCAEMKLSSRSTPALSGDQDPIVLLDGEIYNTPKGKTNVDYLRELYLAKKKECFSEIDGVWACVIKDGEEIIMARDPIGPRPLIYGHKNNEFYFASEAKALKDLLDEIKELPPGQFYSSLTGELKPFKPFEPELPDFDPEDSEGIAKILKKTMIEAIEKTMVDGALGGIALSGGLDSSIVTAVVLKELGQRLPQLTSTVKKSPGPDLHYTKRLVKYWGIEKDLFIKEITHKEIFEIIPQAVYFLESFDQDCISGWIANYYTAQAAAEKGINCVIVGETADEIAGGYFGEFFEDVGEMSWKEIERIYPILIDIAHNTGLRRMDRGWHAKSIQPRTPFADPKLVTLCRRIPMKWKCNYDCGENERREKWILRKAFEDEKLLPAEITWRPKLRFARGVGVDYLMDDIVEKNISKEEKKQLQELEEFTPFTKIKLASLKERYYYYQFIKQFPKAYENMCVRWDPFIQ